MTVKKQNPGTCENCGKKANHLVFHRICRMCRNFEMKHGRLPEIAERKFKYASCQLCKRCKRKPVYCKFRCVACYDYWKKTGKERPRDRYTEECMNCGRYLNRDDSELSILHAKGLCKNCYSYQAHHSGRARPQCCWGIGKYGYCDCGNAANHNAEVRINRHNDIIAMCDECFEEYQRQIKEYGR